MRYRIHHQTTYDYAQNVSFSQHLLHMSPRTSERQTCTRSRVFSTPQPEHKREDTDFFGNTIVYMTIQEPHKQLKIRARSDVDVSPAPQIDLESSPAWEAVAGALAGSTSPDVLDASQFIFGSHHVAWTDEARTFAEVSFSPGRPILAGAMDLTSRIFNEFTYKGGVTDVSTPVAEVLRTRQGVCQDFAHVQIACLRSLGLPARYVSGYLLTHPPEGQEKLIGADESHAWVSVWCPDIGWIDFDATNNLIPSDEHITLGWGRDYSDVSPINGFMIGGGSHTVEVSVDVQPRGS